VYRADQVEHLKGIVDDIEHNVGCWSANQRALYRACKELKAVTVDPEDEAVLELIRAVRAFRPVLSIYYGVAATYSVSPREAIVLAGAVDRALEAVES
jgi:uncharacterized UPF0146 family protein